MRAMPKRSFRLLICLVAALLSASPLFAAAQTMGIKLQLHDIRKSEDLDDAFAEIRKERPDALLILADRVFLHNRERMMDFTKEQRLPNVNAYKELVEVGGLMSYGPSYETCTGAPRSMSTRSSRGPSRPTCQSNNRVNLRSSSTSRRPKHSASQCRRNFLGSPTN